MKIRVALLKDDKTWEDMLLEMGVGSPMGFSHVEIVCTFYREHPEFFNNSGGFKKPYIGVLHINKEKKCQKKSAVVNAGKRSTEKNPKPWGMRSTDTP
jgi:hypothetical protein